ncbi:hypothetical protein AB5I41_14980 [Sphingomonas sp. MMS24-JH45]
MKADFHPDIDLSYKFDYSQNDYTPIAAGRLYRHHSRRLVRRHAGPSAVPALFYGLSPNPMTPITKKRPDAVNNAFSTPANTSSHGHNLTARWQMTDEIAIDILAFRSAKLYSNYQLDGLGGLVVPGAGFPFVFVASNAGTTQRQWSENKLQVISIRAVLRSRGGRDPFS